MLCNIKNLLDFLAKNEDSSLDEILQAFPDFTREQVLLPIREARGEQLIIVRRDDFTHRPVYRVTRKGRTAMRNPEGSILEPVKMTAVPEAAMPVAQRTAIQQASPATASIKPIQVKKARPIVKPPVVIDLLSAGMNAAFRKHADER